MRRYAIAAALAAGLAAAVALADRTDVWLTNSVAVYQVELFKLPDGGCSVRAWANVTKSDGGTISDGSDTVEVSGSNRTTCLDVINVKAPALFKADKGL